MGRWIWQAARMAAQLEKEAAAKMNEQVNRLRNDRENDCRDAVGAARGVETVALWRATFTGGSATIHSVFRHFGSRGPHRTPPESPRGSIE